MDIVRRQFCLLEALQRLDERLRALRLEQHNLPQQLRPYEDACAEARQELTRLHQTIEQTERYEGRIEVELQIIADNGAVEGTITTQITRSVTAAEDLTLNERERMWYRMTEAMMKDLDAQLDSTIKQHLYRFILL